MEAAAASAMDFHALSRRELQALCKRNGVRANMTNAAMAEALQGLASVDGIDEIGTTLCLPTPGRSTMKSAAKAAAAAGEEPQQGSPLPRGRRVSVMSPSVIRMDVEEGDDEVKRDLAKEIVKTPGVALRSTSRRARATPAPLPTPATLRRSQRTAARMAAAPVEAESRAEEVMSMAKKTTGRASGRSKMMVDLDQEEEVAAAAPEEEKVQQEEPKAVASDVKCDDPEEEEVTKILDGDSKEEEPEEGEEADSSDAANGSAVVSDKSCDVLKVEEVAVVVEEDATKPQEGIVEAQEPISVEKSAALAPAEDSPILGVLSRAEATESVTEKEQDGEGFSAEDGEGSAEWSPVKEMTDEISPVAEDKSMAVDEEAIKEDGFAVTAEAVHFPMEILPAAVAEDEPSELTEEKGGAADGMLQSELIDDENSEEDDLDEDEEWSSDDGEASEEIDSTDESDEENDETYKDSDCTEGSTDLHEQRGELVQMLQETAIAKEASEDGSVEEASEDGSVEEASEDDSVEEDDSTSDLPPEFDNIMVLSDAETDSEAAVASATKTAVKALDDSAISEVQEVSSYEDVSEGADVAEEAMKQVDKTVDTIVKSLDYFTIKDGTQQAEDEKLNAGSKAVGAKDMQKGLQVEDYNAMSMRKLKSIYKDALNAKEGKKQVTAEEGKRQPLTEVDDNVGADC